MGMAGITIPKPTATPSPQATALANYIDSTHQGGYGGFDPNVLVATSNGATGHPTHNAILDTVKSGLADAWKSVGHFFSDPATKVPANTAQITSDHFNNTGIQTFKPVDLTLSVGNKYTVRGTFFEKCTNFGPSYYSSAHEKTA
ncbi:MAG: hypothetical protein RL622_191 [Actinomycetota bacterium]